MLKWKTDGKQSQVIKINILIQKLLKKKLAFSKPF